MVIAAARRASQPRRQPHRLTHPTRPDHPKAHQDHRRPTPHRPRHPNLRYPPASRPSHRRHWAYPWQVHRHSTGPQDRHPGRRPASRPPHRWPQHPPKAHPDRRPPRPQVRQSPSLQCLPADHPNHRHRTTGPQDRQTDRPTAHPDPHPPRLRQRPALPGRTRYRLDRHPPPSRLAQLQFHSEYPQHRRRLWVLLQRAQDRPGCHPDRHRRQFR